MYKRQLALLCGAASLQLGQHLSSLLLGQGVDEEQDGNCNAVAQEVDAGVALPDGVHNACGLHSACGNVVADGTQHKAGQAAGNGACKLAEERVGGVNDALVALAGLRCV